MERESFGSILRKKKLKFKNNKELEKYYEQKWKKEGYRKGYRLHGINISKIYHKARLNSAFALLKPNKKEFILDAGCGGGELALRISKKCKKIYAVDIAQNAFSKNKKKAPKNLIFKKMDVENLKFKDFFFDKIVSVETLEHVLRPKKVLKEFSRVIKSKGMLVLTYPTINTTTISKLQNAVKIGKPLEVSEHLTEWDYDTLIKNVEKNGFRFLESKGLVFDLGKIGTIKLLSKTVAKKLTDFQLSITNFPRNSLFVSLVFEKK